MKKRSKKLISIKSPAQKLYDEIVIVAQRAKNKEVYVTPEQYKALLKYLHHKLEEKLIICGANIIQKELTGRF